MQKLDCNLQWSFLIALPQKPKFKLDFVPSIYPKAQRAQTNVSVNKYVYFPCVLSVDRVQTMLQCAT